MDLELIGRNVGYKGPALLIPAKPHFPCFVRLMRAEPEFHILVCEGLIKPVTRDLGLDTEMWVE